MIVIIVASVLIILVCISACVSFKETFTPMKPQTYDILSVSPAMAFKERNSQEIQSALTELEIPTLAIDKDTAVSILQRQLGADYEAKSWVTEDAYHEVVMQAPGKMYGIDIVIPKDYTWHPKVRGFVFDDILNFFPANKSA